MASDPATTPIAPDARRLALAGTWNLRHVGGYESAAGRIADRMLWRGDALRALDDDGRRLLAELPLRTVIDLRDDGERDAMPNRLDGVGARIVTIPLRVRGIAGEPGADVETWRAGDLSGFYVYLARTRAAEIAAAVAALAGPGALPALVHCTAGKDRTGVVIAVALSALGVADADVIADFALSSSYLDAAFADHARRAMATPVDRRASDRVLLDAEPEWIAAALAAIRAGHGDAAAYLFAHGVEPQALDALGAALVAAPA